MYVLPQLRGESYKDPLHQRRGKVFLSIQRQTMEENQITVEFVIEYWKQSLGSKVNYGI